MPSEVEFTGRAYRLRLSESELGQITDALDDLADNLTSLSNLSAPALSAAIYELREAGRREFGKAASFKLVAIAREEE